MLGSLKTLLAGLLVVGGVAYGAATKTQCKTACKSELKPACEKACRQGAPNIADQCIKEMCPTAFKRCEAMCDDLSSKDGK